MAGPQQPHQRLGDAERRVLSYAFADRSNLASVIDAFESERPSTPGPDELLAGLEALHAVDDAPSMPSLLALGCQERDISWAMEWMESAYEHPIERAVDALRVARVLALADTILRSSAATLSQAKLTADSATNVLDEISNTLVSISSSLDSHRKELPTVHDNFDEWVERQRAQAERGSCTWGTKALDEAAGQFTPGTVTAVAGLPGHGKSILGVNATYASACQGKRSLVVCLEMDGPELSMRYAASANQMHAHTLRSIAVDPQEGELESIKSKIPTIITTVSCSVAHSEHLIRQARSRGEPYDFVVYDYLQMFHHGKADSEALRLQETVYFMKQRVAMAQSVGVLLLCQFNKQESGMGMPRFRNVRGASAIEDAVDIAICILRDGEPSETTLDGQKHYNVEVEVQKFRNGQIGPLRQPLQMIGGEFRMIDSPDSFAETI